MLPSSFLFRNLLCYGRRIGAAGWADRLANSRHLVRCRGHGAKSRHAIPPLAAPRGLLARAPISIRVKAIRPIGGGNMPIWRGAIRVMTVCPAIAVAIHRTVLRHCPFSSATPLPLPLLCGASTRTGRQILEIERHIGIIVGIAEGRGSGAKGVRTSFRPNRRCVRGNSTHRSREGNDRHQRHRAIRRYRCCPVIAVPIGVIHCNRCCCCGVYCGKRNWLRIGGRLDACSLWQGKAPGNPAHRASLHPPCDHRNGRGSSP